MKEAFSVEEEGFEEEPESDNLLQEFIQYIKVSTDKIHYIHMAFFMKSPCYVSR